jgi:hypothetical protein
MIVVSGAFFFCYGGTAKVVVLVQSVRWWCERFGQFLKMNNVFFFPGCKQKIEGFFF